MFLSIFCRLVLDKEVASAINFVIHEQFYSDFYNWNVVLGDVKGK